MSVMTRKERRRLGLTVRAAVRAAKRVPKHKRADKREFARLIAQQLPHECPALSDPAIVVTIDWDKVLEWVLAILPLIRILLVVL